MTERDHPSPNDPTWAWDGPAEESEPGHPETIGRYRLVRSLGQGGMGEVFLAEQQSPVKRQVALKLVKLGMDTTEVVARFESERQALALMDHPHIARIYDGGSTSSGRPYFVMEYVHGLRITDYCDQNQLDLEARLELFVAVCKAIHHAHQRGIIHRDVKPSNVLVTEVEGKPVPKIIDFGIAKATQQELNTRTLLTAKGELIGTPMYMSPEQASMTGLNVGTTSDVYSLGVLLYELLVGVPPFDAEQLRAAGLAEIHRIIRDVDPPKPSTRISTLGETASGRANQRRVDLRSWQRRLSGDLDWIIMRALEKHWSRRYPSASEFAADIENHLGNRPVSAGPRSATYRARLFVRRNRALVVSLSAIFLALTAGVIVSTSLYVYAQRTLQEQRWQTYLASMRAASLSWQEKDTAGTLQALESCPESLRDWAWRFLDGRADQSRPVLPLEDAGSGLPTVSPDGRWLATIRMDSTRWLYDLEGRVPARAVGGGLAHAGEPAFTPDSRLLVGGLRDGRIKAWNTATGEEEMGWSAASSPIREVEIHPDGDLLAIKAWDDTAHVWSLESRSVLYEVPLRSGFYQSMLFTADGQSFVAAGMGHPVRVFDAFTGELRHSSGQGPQADFSVIENPVSRQLYIGQGNKLYEIDVAGGHVQPRVDGDHVITGAAVSPDGTRIVTADIAGGIEVWDPEGGNRLASLRGHRDSAVLIAFVPDRRVFVSGGDSVHAWDFSSPGGPGFIPTDRWVRHASFGADSRRLALGKGNRVEVLDLDSGATMKVFDAAEDGIVALDADGRGLRIAAALRNEEVVLYEWQGESAPIRSLPHPEGPIRCVSFSPDGRLLASGTGAAVADGELQHRRDFRVRIWDVGTGELVWEAEPGEGGISNAVFSPDGSLLATGSWNGVVRLWDATNGELISSSSSTGSNCVAIAVSPDGREVATAYWNERAVRVHSVPDLDESWKFTDLEFGSTGCAFSPDGHLFYTLDITGGIDVYVRPSYQRILAIPCYTQAMGMKVSPDGESLIVSTYRNPPVGLVIVAPDRWTTGLEHVRP